MSRGCHSIFSTPVPGSWRAALAKPFIPGAYLKALKHDSIFPKTNAARIDSKEHCFPTIVLPGTVIGIRPRIISGTLARREPMLPLPNKAVNNKCC